MQIREKESDINCLTSSGLPKPLGAIARVPRPDTKEVIPDDGFVRFAKMTLDLERFGDYNSDNHEKSFSSQNLGETRSQND